MEIPLKNLFKSPEKPYLKSTEIMDGREAKDLAGSMQRFELKSGALVCAGTDKGIDYKDNNEDRTVICPAADFVAVVDGMGGESNGELAAEILAKKLSITPDDIPFAVSEAKREMEVKGVGDGGALFISAELKSDNDGKYLDIKQIGDAKLIVIKKDGRVSFVSTDHSLVESLVRGGAINQDEALYHPRRNEVNRAVGPGLEDKVTKYTQGVETGDMVLLYSDGISDNFTPEEIAQKVKDGLSREELFKWISYATGERMRNKKEIIKKSKRKEMGEFSDGYKSEPKCDNRSLVIMEIGKDKTNQTTIQEPVIPAGSGKPTESQITNITKEALNLSHELEGLEGRKLRIERDLAELGESVGKEEAGSQGLTEQVLASIDINGHEWKAGDEFVTPQGERMTIGKIVMVDGQERIYHTKDDGGFKLRNEILPIPASPEEKEKIRMSQNAFNVWTYFGEDFGSFEKAKKLSNLKDKDFELAIDELRALYIVTDDPNFGFMKLSRKYDENKVEVEIITVPEPVIPQPPQPIITPPTPPQAPATPPMPPVTPPNPPTPQTGNPDNLRVAPPVVEEKNKPEEKKQNREKVKEILARLNDEGRMKKRGEEYAKIDKRLAEIEAELLKFEVENIKIETYKRRGEKLIREEIEADRKAKPFAYFLAGKINSPSILKNMRGSRADLRNCKFVRDEDPSTFDFYYPQVLGLGNDEGYIECNISGFVLSFNNVKGGVEKNKSNYNSEHKIFEIIGPDGKIVAKDIKGYTAAKKIYNEKVAEYLKKVEEEFKQSQTKK